MALTLVRHDEPELSDDEYTDGLCSALVELQNLRNRSFTMVMGFMAEGNDDLAASETSYILVRFARAVAAVDRAFTSAWLP